MTSASPVACRASAAAAHESRCFTRRRTPGTPRSGASALRQSSPSGAGRRCSRSPPSGRSCPRARSAAGRTQERRQPVDEVPRRRRGGCMKRTTARVAAGQARAAGPRNAGWAGSGRRTPGRRPPAAPCLKPKLSERDHHLGARAAAVARHPHEDVAQLVDGELARCPRSCRPSRGSRASFSRSSRMPSATDRSGASGCGRRVSLNRRTSDAVAGLEEDQRRPRARAACAAARARAGNSPQEVRSRGRPRRAPPCPGRRRRGRPARPGSGISCVGRLSTQK